MDVQKPLALPKHQDTKIVPLRSQAIDYLKSAKCLKEMEQESQTLKTQFSQQQMSSFRVIGENKEFMPYQNERNHLGQLLSNESIMNLYQHKQLAKNKFTVSSIVKPSPQHRLVKSGKQIYFDKAGINMTLIKKYQSTNNLMSKIGHHYLSYSESTKNIGHPTTQSNNSINNNYGTNPNANNNNNSNSNSNSEHNNSNSNGNGNQSIPQSDYILQNDIVQINIQPSSQCQKNTEAEAKLHQNTLDNNNNEAQYDNSLNASNYNLNNIQSQYSKLRIDTININTVRNTKHSLGSPASHINNTSNNNNYNRHSNSISNSQNQNSTLNLSTSTANQYNQSCNGNNDDNPYNIPVQNPENMAENRYFIKHLPESEKNLSEFRVEKKEKLPKLKIYNKALQLSKRPDIGPGSYQIKYEIVEKHVPNPQFQSQMVKSTKSINDSSVDRYLPIFHRNEKQNHNQGYEQVFMKLIREINRDVKNEQAKNQNNLLHPNKLILPHIDGRFVDEFEKNYHKKLRLAKNLSNHLKLLMKTDFN